MIEKRPMTKANESESMWKASVVSDMDLVIWPATSSTRKKRKVMASMHVMRILLGK